MFALNLKKPRVADPELDRKTLAPLGILSLPYVVSNEILVTQI